MIKYGGKGIRTPDSVPGDDLKQRGEIFYDRGQIVVQNGGMPRKQSGLRLKQLF
jgi:hypothetical protein